MNSSLERRMILAALGSAAAALALAGLVASLTQPRQRHCLPAGWSGRSGRRPNNRQPGSKP